MQHGGSAQWLKSPVPPCRAVPGLFKKPRTPERTIWVPLFRQLAETHEGLHELQEFAAARMRGCNCPAAYLECLDATFHDLGFRSRVIAALHDFADTACEKLSLPEPMQTIQPVSSTTLKRATQTAPNETDRAKLKRPPGLGSEIKL
jgi:hypothetical protein